MSPFRCKYAIYRYSWSLLYQLKDIGTPNINEITKQALKSEKILFYGLRVGIIIMIGDLNYTKQLLIKARQFLIFQGKYVVDMDRLFVIILEKEINNSTTLMRRSHLHWRHSVQKNDLGKVSQNVSFVKAKFRGNQLFNRLRQEQTGI